MNMISLLSNLNWIGVLLAVLAYSFLGALWFTTLFTKPYRLSLGKENEPPQKLAPIFIIGPTLCMLVITIAHAMLMQAMHIETYGASLRFALLVGLGYLVANTVNIAINPNIPRPLLYSAISGAYHLVGIVVASLTLVAIG